MCNCAWWELPIVRLTAGGWKLAIWCPWYYVTNAPLWCVLCSITRPCLIFVLLYYKTAIWGQELLHCKGRKFATKPLVKFNTVWKADFSCSKWKILHLADFFGTTRGCDVVTNIRYAQDWKWAGGGKLIIWRLGHRSPVPGDLATNSLMSFLTLRVQMEKQRWRSPPISTMIIIRNYANMRLLHFYKWENLMLSANFICDAFIVDKQWISKHLWYSIKHFTDRYIFLATIVFI